MSLFTYSQLGSMDLIGPFGPYVNMSARSSISVDDLIAPFGHTFTVDGGGSVLHTLSLASSCSVFGLIQKLDRKKCVTNISGNANDANVSKKLNKRTTSIISIVTSKSTKSWKSSRDSITSVGALSKVSKKGIQGVAHDTPLERKNLDKEIANQLGITAFINRIAKQVFLSGISIIPKNLREITSVNRTFSLILPHDHKSLIKENREIVLSSPIARQIISSIKATRIDISSKIQKDLLFLLNTNIGMDMVFLKKIEQLELFNLLITPLLAFGGVSWNNIKEVWIKGKELPGIMVRFTFTGNVLLKGVITNPVSSINSLSKKLFYKNEGDK